jgi:uncharacterized protein (TIGR02118 family)
MSEPGMRDSDSIRCVVLLSHEDAAEHARIQQTWLGADPVPALVADVANRYVRSLPLPSQERGFNPRELFGVAQVWVDGVGPALSACEELAALGGAAGDPLFAGCGVKAIPMRELVVIDGQERPGGSDGLKALVFACRKPGMTVAHFQAHWRDVHGPLVIGTPGLERYVQCHPCPESYDLHRPAYDSLAELTFADVAALAAFNAPSPQRSAQGEDLPNLWDMTVRTPRVFVRDDFDLTF